MFLYGGCYLLFKSLRAGSQVFALLMFVLGVILHTMWSSKTLQLIWYVVLVCHQYDVCKDYIGSVYVGGYVGLSKSKLCVFRELCAVRFHIVGESPSVLL